MGYHSKLSNHKFNKGVFVTPFNSIPNVKELEDEKSWTYGRMPEYLWIGLILKKFGRDDGFQKLHTVFKYLSELYVAANPIDEKMCVLLGLATYSYKRLKEVYCNNLFNSITGRARKIL